LFAGAMAKDNHERNAVGECVHDGREGIAAPWSFSDHRDSHLASAPRITVGYVDGSLLVPRQHERHLAILMECIENGQDVVARQGCDEFHSFGFEDIDYGIGDTHKFVFSTLL
jgi:hypothetical protein